MSLQGRWLLDASALAARYRPCMKLLAAVGVILSVASLDGSRPSQAGLMLAAAAVALAALGPVLLRGWRALRASRSGGIPALHMLDGDAPAELWVDSRGRVVRPSSPVDAAVRLRPVQWHRAQGRLWVALRDARGEGAVLSGRLRTCDDASAARLDAWLVWLRRGPRG